MSKQPDALGVGFNSDQAQGKSRLTNRGGNKMKPVKVKDQCHSHMCGDWKIYKRYPERYVCGDFRRDKVLWVGCRPKKWVEQKRVPFKQCEGQSLKEVQQSIMRIEGVTK